MPVKIYLTDAQDISKSLNLGGEEELVSTLGKSEAFAVTIEDVLSSVASIVGKNISNEAEIVIELSGSTSLKADGKIGYLFLNIGGAASKDNSMKITIKTKVCPEKAV